MLAASREARRIFFVSCVYCLACVGLEGAEYHVLNKKVSKKEFYRLLNRMREELDARVEGGWRPEVIGLVSMEEEELEEEEWPPQASKVWPSSAGAEEA